MCKKLVFLVSPILLLILAGNAVAQLNPAAVTDGHVFLFENVAGTQVPDDSSNSAPANSTLVGDPQVVAGMAGGNALQFDGVDDGIDIPDSAFINVTNGPWANRTIVAVFKCDDVDKTTKQTIFEEGGNTRGMTFYIHEGLLYAAAWNRAEYNWDGAWLSAPIESNNWYGVAMVIRDGAEAVEDDKFEMWLNGQLVAKAPGGHIHNHSNDNAIGYTRENNVFHDGNAGSNGHWFEGAIDEVWILNVALTASELGGFAGKVWPFAFGPDPADGSLFENTWANLAWTPGGFAVSHDVYFGTSLEDVNNGAEGTFVGNIAAAVQIVGFPGFPVAEGLETGTTYYWRVDEVNDAEPNSPWKGDVWSFTVPPRIAYNADPPDGMKFVDPNVILSWTGGFGTKLHHVYLGDSFDDVNSAAGALPLADAFFTPGALELDKTYYWRVDEFDGATTNKGDVWSFTTLPPIPVTDDPDLVAWWRFDEGIGTTVLDWSGRGNNGTIFDQGWSSPGWHGDAALDAAGSGYVAIQNLSYAETDLTAVTVTAWIRTSSSETQYIVSFDRNEYWRLEVNGDGAGDGQIGWDVMTSTGQVDYGSITRIDDGRWHHITGVFDNGRSTIYIDGIPEPSATGGPTFGSGNTRFGFIGANSEAVAFDGSRGGGSAIAGLVDDVRIYSAALTEEQIILVMRGDPLLAWKPTPADETVPDVDNVTPLTWSPGDKVSSHEVYFGTDRDAVKNADTSDTTGIYRGSQSGTSFTPAEGVEWGAGPFYWRIDENNTDGTVTKGRVWSFTVADFILVDDFEGYTDNDAENEAIWQHWIDGFGIPTNGSQVGYLLPSYAEQTIINSGGQSMPISYDNTAGVTYSQAELALTAPRDWTKHGVGVLSLWFRGYPPSVGSFTEGPVGTFTMTGSGTDIWSTSDEFHFAYKTLTGPGTIVARVDSIENTHNWAKAGVMIRETLDADSKYAFALVSAASGVAAQNRLDTGVSATGTTEAGIAAPHWVKLERDAAGFFTVSHSTNGSSWIPVAGSLANNIPMVSTVYVGLAVTSHDATATCEAKFSNVTITGTAGQQWMHQDIGILANNAEPLYVSLANAAGTPAVVVNEDANAAVTDVWTQWNIDLSKFSDQGINLADVDKIAVGLGARGGATADGGSGTVFVDDIRLLRPAPQPEPEPQP
ncbi:MAG: hypothetical protein CEE38_19510 [Planctomycetes bacterium B3_Pla]|nr:MAG: hypothetical protein CEE38_19510 [Planctomycetes bacterium B3_Pla]